MPGHSKNRRHATPPAVRFALPQRRTTRCARHGPARGRTPTCKSLHFSTAKPSAKHDEREQASTARSATTSWSSKSVCRRGMRAHGRELREKRVAATSSSITRNLSCQTLDSPGEHKCHMLNAKLHSSTLTRERRAASARHEQPVRSSQSHRTFCHVPHGNQKWGARLVSACR